jgi:NitT/TauT family transport system ATP-binding protein
MSADEGRTREGRASAPERRVNAPETIEVRRLRKVFHQTGTGEAVVAIERLDFDIQRGDMVAIVGQTGCGKSTFLNLLIGLERPSDGHIAIGGRKPYDDFEHFRGVLAAVFQQDRLLPWRSALDNVRLPLELLGRHEREQVDRARSWLHRLGLAGFEGAYPHELSGGMRQRVALARAFVIEPALLLADEAFGHLDEVTAAALRKSFLDLARTEGNTAVLVTHQLEEAIEMGGRILVFGKPGKLLADIDLRAWPADSVSRLRAIIQRMLQTNEPDPEIALTMARESS